LQCGFVRENFSLAILGSLKLSNYKWVRSDRGKDQAYFA